jgi:glycosyltransferase involved in cell wall biosynthesis
MATLIQSYNRESFSPDIVCFSHLRWNWVFQRPQHLLTRAAKTHRVLFFEEPVHTDGLSRLELAFPHPNLIVATPHVSSHLTANLLDSALKALLDLLLRQQAVSRYLLWYYSPMALRFSRHLRPLTTVYDCMDQLSAFAGAPPDLLHLEKVLLSRSNIVFTGGFSLYQAKRCMHHNVYCFPSSVDLAHFETARGPVTLQPDDQQGIPCPRLGYFGVIDERLDLSLIASVAQARPHWQLVLVGPVTKLDERLLPRAANIHYLGQKCYEELPAYVAGWDVALMPFARNESTEYISPTKTPEYLAAGKPVVSTSIRDVVRTYGEPGFVRIADDVDSFITSVEHSMLEDPLKRVANVDTFLKQQSWDKTWSRMQLILDSLKTPGGASAKAA